MLTPLVRIIIIDDEPVICQSLQNLIVKNPGFLVVATGGSVKEALGLIPAFQPDLLLLDVSLGEETGFEILEQLLPLSFKVIFITGFDKYAIKAIKYGALDYLLKPIDEMELSSALNKALGLHPVSYEQLSFSQNQLYLRQEPEKLLLRANQLLHVVWVKEILYLQSESGITTFHITDDQSISVHKTISEYEELLPPSQFIRVHQSYLVNKDHIKGFHHSGWLVLRNGEQLPVAIRRKEYVISVLSDNR